LSSSSSEPIVVGTLEQLAFYESVKEQNLLEDNRYVIQIDNIDDDSSEAVLRVVQMILWKYPSASAVLDAHSGRLFHIPSSRQFSDDFGKKVGITILEDPKRSKSKHYGGLYCHDRRPNPCTGVGKAGDRKSL
jgi:hypothetical protein